MQQVSCCLYYTKYSIVKMTWNLLNSKVVHFFLKHHVVVQCKYIYFHWFFNVATTKHLYQNQKIFVKKRWNTEAGFSDAMDTSLSVWIRRLRVKYVSYWASGFSIMSLVGHGRTLGLNSGNIMKCSYTKYPILSRFSWISENRPEKTPNFGKTVPKMLQIRSFCGILQFSPQKCPKFYFFFP